MNIELVTKIFGSDSDIYKNSVGSADFLINCTGLADLITPIHPPLINESLSDALKPKVAGSITTAVKQTFYLAGVNTLRKQHFNKISKPEYLQHKHYNHIPRFRSGMTFKQCEAIFTLTA